MPRLRPRGPTRTAESPAGDAGRAPPGARFYVRSPTPKKCAWSRTATAPANNAARRSRPATLRAAPSRTRMTSCARFTRRSRPPDDRSAPRPPPISARTSMASTVVDSLVARADVLEVWWLVRDLFIEGHGQASSDGEGRSAPQILRALRVQVRRHYLCAARAASVQLQQPLRRVPHVSGFRQHHRSRPRSRHPEPGAVSRGRRGRAVDETAVRLGAHGAAPLLPLRRHPRQRPFRVALQTAAARRRRRQRQLGRRQGLLRVAGDEEVQAARPRLPRQVPRLHALPRLRRRPTASGGARRSRRRPDAARGLLLSRRAQFFETLELTRAGGHRRQGAL